VDAHKKEISFSAWLDLCEAIGFAQGTLRGIAAQSSDELIKRQSNEAVKRLDAAVTNTKL